MSVLVFYQGVMGCDSRGIRDRGGWRERTFAMHKMWVDTKEHCLFGMVGENVSSASKGVWTLYLTQLIVKHEQERSFSVLNVELPDRFKNDPICTDATRLLIATRRYVYEVNRGKVIELDETECITMGTGSRVVTLGLVNGLSVHDSIQLATKVMAETGGEIYTKNIKELTLIKRAPKKRVRKNAA